MLLDEIYQVWNNCEAVSDGEILGIKIEIATQHQEQHLDLSNNENALYKRTNL